MVKRTMQEKYLKILNLSDSKKKMIVFKLSEPEWHDDVEPKEKKKKKFGMAAVAPKPKAGAASPTKSAQRSPLKAGPPSSITKPRKKPAAGKGNLLKTPQTPPRTYRRANCSEWSTPDSK